MKQHFPLILLLLLAFACHQPTDFDTIIRNGQVVDGSGKPSYIADVGIRADTVAAVGDLADKTADQEIDAKGDRKSVV